MRDYSKLLRRAISLSLAIALVFLSLANLGLALPVSATGSGSEFSKTEGQIIAENYALTADEKALLNSGLLIGETITYDAPKDDDGLITIDDSTKTITVTTFPSGDYTWIPVSGRIVDIGGVTKEDVIFTDNKATYEYDGNAFTVKVDYVVSCNIDEEKQETILNAVANIKEGLANLNVLLALKDDLKIIEAGEGSTASSSLGGGILELLIGDGIKATVSAWGGTANVTIKFDSTKEIQENAIYAAEDILTHFERNDGFLLSAMLDEYSAAESKVQYLIENGDTLRRRGFNDIYDTLADLYNGLIARFDGIYSVENIKSLDSSKGQVLEAYINAYKAFLDGAKDIEASKWAVHASNPVKDGLTDAEWKELDTLISNIDTPTEISNIKGTLELDRTTLGCNLQMYNVTFNVSLKIASNVPNDLSLRAYETKSVVVTLPANASAAEVMDAIEASGLEVDALNEWRSEEAYVDAKFYPVRDSFVGELTSDVAYNVTYSPMLFNLKYDYDNTSDGTPAQAPYGFIMTLPAATEQGKVYDYKVNGKSYYQSEMIVVDGDMVISRTDGKPYDVNETLNTVVGSVYFDSNNKASAILGSGALTIGNDIVSVRNPDPSYVTLTGTTLTARAYDATYNGLIWVPAYYTVVGGAYNGVKGSFAYSAGDYVADIEATNYSSISVTYKLALTNFSDEYVLSIYNIPEILISEYNAQKSALTSLYGINDNLSLLSMLPMLRSMIEGADYLNPDPVKNAAIKAEFLAVLDGINSECVQGSDLKLYKLLKEYGEASDGMLYYYKNSESFIYELDVLCGYVNRLLKDEDHVTALENLAGNAPPALGDVSGMISKIETLKDSLASIQERLTPPSDYININSVNINKLMLALASEGSASGADVLPYEFALNFGVSVDAPDKSSVDIILRVEGGKTVTVKKTYSIGEELDAADIADIKAAVSEAIATLGIDTDLYTTTYTPSDIDALNGKEVTTISALTYDWTAKQFTVHIEGTASQKVSVNSATIYLPASPDAAFRYEYTIGSKQGIRESYTFTASELKTLFVNGEYSVARTVIDILESEYENFVNSLNESADDTVEFILVKGDSKYSIIMKVNASAPTALMGSIQGIAMGFVMSGYSYIGLDSNGVLDNGNISLQAVVDAIMTSGFGTQTLLSAINANGTINNMTLPGAVIVGDGAHAGGKLIKTTMNIGSSLAQSSELDFYITLGSVSDQIVKVRNLIDTQLGSYMSLECSGGKLNVALTMPEKAYEAYLAALLVTENVDISDINSVNSEIAIGFIKDLLAPIFADDVTVETLENTLKLFGYKIELSEYSDIFELISKRYDEMEIDYDAEDSGSVTGTLPIKPIIDRLNIGKVGEMISEYNTGIRVTLGATLRNINKNYEAMYVDINAAGVTNKIGLTDNVAAKIAGISGTSVIVLLSDVESNLVFNKTTVLNLNGFTVNGDIVANGNVTIVDTSFDIENVGSVTGNVMGKLTITGGEYSHDVSNFLKAGYVQNAGIVENEFYSFVKDASGNLTINIDAGIIETNEMPDVKTLLIDLVIDMLFNGYTTNKLYINDNKVYNIAINDFFGIYTGENRIDTLVNHALEMIDSKALANIVNTLIADLTNFENIQNAILNDAPVVEYDMTTAAWNVVIEHITAGDYLSPGIASGDDVQRKLFVRIVGTEEEKNSLAGIFGVLEDTTDVDVSIDLDHSFAGAGDKEIVLDWSGSAVVKVDLTGDSKYAVMFSVIIADGIKGASKTALINGIKTYYDTGMIADLETAFNALKTSDIVTAVKAIGANDEFAVMLDNLGLSGIVSSDVEDLEELFDRYAKVIAAALRKTEFTGGDRTLGSFYEEGHGYGVSRDNLDKTITKSLFKGYDVTLNLDIPTIYVYIEIFADDNADVPTAPEFTDTPVVDDAKVEANDKLASVTVIGDKIMVDAHSDGIDAETLKSIIEFSTIDAGDTITYTVETKDGRIFTGAKFTVTAENAAGTTVVVCEIVVVGDTNGDGYSDVNDALSITTKYANNDEFEGLGLLAADINSDGEVDVLDALAISHKYANWEEYASNNG